MTEGVINYKVFAWNGTAWEQQARFPAAGEPEARELAKTLEFTDKKLVKITCEMYESSSQSFVNKVIYMTKQAAEATLSPQKRRYSNEPQSIMRAAPRVMLVIFLALTVAVGVARYGGQMLASTELVDEEEAVPLSFALFIILFVIFSVWFGLSFIPKITSDVRGDNGSETEYTSATTEQIVKEPLKNVKGNNPLDKLSVFISSVVATFFGAPEEKADESQFEKSVDEILKEKRSELREHVFTPPELTLSTVQKKSKTADGKKVGSKEQTASDGLRTVEVMASPLRQDLLMQLTGLLGLIFDTLQKNNMPADAYTLFGVRLLIAGALDNVSERNAFSETERMDALLRLFKQMNIAAYMAEVFFEKLPEYKQDVVCQPMLEHGHFLWDSFVDNPASYDIPVTIQQVLSQWSANQQNSLADEATKGSFFVVMFTDIVGSTGMTQTLGDKSAQHIIHVHNTIVRQALSEYSGHEIKLTGDGLMASFTSVSSAIEAASAIQKALHYYNQAKENSPLHIRIGLNAGEPIVEGNDLFGTVVQIASRVCNLAEPDEIYVSSLVKELAFGKPYVFEDKGMQQLKGISQPQQIFAVKWDASSDKGE